MKGGPIPEKVVRPGYCTEEHLQFLDALRASGKTNMYGAQPYLQRAFRRLKDDQAAAVLLYWKSSFSERHQKEV